MSQEVTDFSFSIGLLNARCLHYEQQVITFKRCKCNKDVENQVEIRKKIKELRAAIEKLKSDNGTADKRD